MTKKDLPKTFRIKYQLLPLNLSIDVNAPSLSDPEDMATHLGYDARAGAPLVKYVVHTIEEINPQKPKKR